MPIVRQSLSFEGRFTQIPNDWLRDSRTSLKAKGLLSQLLSHVDGWEVSIHSLARANGCGRDTIRSAVSELEDAGYLTRTQGREDGSFAEAVWFTTEPWSDSPSSGNPTSGNPTTKNTIEKNTIPEELTPAFDEFYEVYPRRVGRGAARRAFDKALKVAEAAEIIAGARRLADDPNLPETRFIPYPATWLNREGWGDEPYPDEQPKKPVADIPGKDDWKKWYHDQDDHTFCDHDG